MKKYLIPGIVIIALVGMIFAAIFFKKDTSKSVFTTKVSKSNFEDVVSVNGTLIPKIKVSIMSEVMGKIEDIPVKEGDMVHKGDVVAVINGKDLQSDVNRMKASLKIAEIQVKQQKVEVERNENIFNRKEKLYKKDLISLDEIELAEITLRKSKLTLLNYIENVKQTYAQLDKSNELMAKTIIKSPIDGKITALYKEVGEQVIQGTINISGSVIMEISDMSGIELEVELNEVESSRVKIGMKTKVTLDAILDKAFMGKISEIGQSAYKPVGKDISVLKVKINLDETSDSMKPGLGGQADIVVLEKKDAVTVPIEAVLDEKNDKNDKATQKSNSESEPKPKKVEKSTIEIKPKQYVLKFENGIAKKVIVETGFSNDSEMEILKGLKVDDTVIIGPYRVLSKLKDKDKVKRKKEDK